MAPKHPDWEFTTPSGPPEGGRSEEHFVRVLMTPGMNMWANGRSRAQSQARADERGVSEPGTALRSPGRRRGVRFS